MLKVKVVNWQKKILDDMIKTIFQNTHLNLSSREEDVLKNHKA